MTITMMSLLYFNCQQTALKQDGMHFILCPTQGNKIEDVVLNRVCILSVFCPKQGQGFKSSHPGPRALFPLFGGGAGKGAGIGRSHDHQTPRNCGCTKLAYDHIQ